MTFLRVEDQKAGLQHGPPTQSQISRPLLTLADSAITTVGQSSSRYSKTVAMVSSAVRAAGSPRSRIVDKELAGNVSACRPTVTTANVRAGWRYPRPHCSRALPVERRAPYRLAWARGDWPLAGPPLPSVLAPGQDDDR
jgi:hypothetical protein